MIKFVLHRILLMVPTILGVSVVAFLVMELPPGDYMADLVIVARREGVQVRRR